MPDEKISQLPTPGAVTTADLVPIVQSGANYAANVSQVLALVPAGITQGTLAARPTAGSSGRLYLTTDSCVLFLDNGSVWVPISTAPGTFRMAAGGGGYPGEVACDGTAYSQTGKYADLFAICGSTWNTFRGQAAPSSGTFRVPLLNGLAPIAKGAAVAAGGGAPATSTRALAACIGEENHQLTINEQPNHSHSASPIVLAADTVSAGLIGSGAGSFDGRSAMGGIDGGDSTYNASGNTGSSGSNLPHNTMQPSCALAWFIHL